MHYFKSTALFLLSTTYALACGPIFEEQGSYNLWDERMISRTWLSLMNIHKDMDHRHNSFDGSAWKIDQDWDDYAKKLGVNLDLTFLINRGDPGQLNHYISENQENPTLIAALEYILFTRESAKVVQTARDFWDWENPAITEDDLLGHLNKVRTAVVGCKDPFLRQRYGFQQVRLETMAGFYLEAEKAYKSYVGGGQSETIRQYGRQWLARAFYKSGQRMKAIRAYSEIYDQFPPLRGTSHMSLKLMKVTPAEWQSMMDETSSNHKKATALFLQNSLQKRDYSASALRKLVEWEPRSDRTEALLVRMIHAIEHYNMEEDHQRLFHQRPASDRYEALIQLCEQAGDMGADIRRPALWYAAGAYLALLDGRRDRAEDLMESAEKSGSENPYIQGQMAMNRFLLLLGEDLDGLNQPQRDELIGLIHRFTGADNSGLTNQKIRKSLIYFAMHRFTAQNDGPRTVLCVRASGFQEAATEILDIMADDQQLAAYEEIYLSGKPLDALDTYLKSFNPMSRSSLIHYRAVNHMRREKYDLALQQMARFSSRDQIDEIEISRDNVTTVEEPVYETIKLDDLCRLFLEKQNQLPDLEKSNIQAAVQLHRELAVIKMSMGRIQHPEVAYAVPRRREWKPTHYNDWPDTWWEMKGPAEFYRNTGFLELEKRLDNFKKAEKHWVRIIELDADREAAAQACVMIQICRNKFAYHEMERNRKDHEYFYILNERYHDTQFLKQFHEECPPAKLFR